MFLSMQGLLWAVSLVGCAPPDTNELVSISVDGPIQIDTFCDGGLCGGFERAVGILSFTANVLIPETGRVEFLQYRIDYDVPGVEIPYFAQQTWALVVVGAESPLEFYPAGDTQRDRARNAIELDGSLDGTATLQAVGYDHKNTIVTVESTFDVHFEDLIPGATVTTGDDDDDNTGLE